MHHARVLSVAVWVCHGKCSMTELWINAISGVAKSPPGFQISCGGRQALLLSADGVFIVPVAFVKPTLARRMCRCPRRVVDVSEF